MGLFSIFNKKENKKRGPTKVQSKRDHFLDKFDTYFSKAIYRIELIRTDENFKEKNIYQNLKKSFLEYETEIEGIISLRDLIIRAPFEEFFLQEDFEDSFASIKKSDLEVKIIYRNNDAELRRHMLVLQEKLNKYRAELSKFRKEMEKAQINSKVIDININKNKNEANLLERRA